MNTYTTANQENAQVSADASGGFVVVWQSGYYGETGADGSHEGISARRYDAAGTPVGAEFVVNTFTPDAQVDPAISVAPSGDFVIAWGGHASYSGPSSSAAGVFVQGFTAAGARRGGEQRANTTTGGFQGTPAVATGAAGDFVVVWTSSRSYYTHEGGDGSGSGILGQRYDSTGAPVGGEFQVNSYTTGYQSASPDRRRWQRWLRGRVEQSGYQLRSIPGRKRHKRDRAALRRERRAAGRRLPGQHLHDGRPAAAGRRSRPARRLRGHVGEQRRGLHDQRVRPALRCERRPCGRRAGSDLRNLGLPGSLVGCGRRERRLPRRMGALQRPGPRPRRRRRLRPAFREHRRAHRRRAPGSTRTRQVGSSSRPWPRTAPGDSSSCGRAATPARGRSRTETRAASSGSDCGRPAWRSTAACMAIGSC